MAATFPAATGLLHRGHCGGHSLETHPLAPLPTLSEGFDHWKIKINPKPKDCTTNPFWKIQLRNGSKRVRKVQQHLGGSQAKLGSRAHAKSGSSGQILAQNPMEFIITIYH
jgi:hypothetical protein